MERDWLKARPVRSHFIAKVILTPPQHAHVDRDRATVDADHQRIDLDLVDARAVVEIELRQAKAVASSAGRSAAGRPRKPASSRTSFNPSIMLLTSGAVTGRSFIVASLASSTRMPPAPISSTGPYSGSVRAPTIASTPVTISCTSTPSMRASGCASARRRAAARRRRAPRGDCAGEE